MRPIPPSPARPVAKGRGTSIFFVAVSACLLAACETWDVDKYDLKLEHKYPVPEDANQTCKDAAKKARYWCRDVNLPTDVTWAQECRQAQWTYNQWCR